MVYIRRGSVVERPHGFGWASIVAALSRLIELVILFFKTILDPNAASNLVERQNSSRSRSSGQKLGGGAPSRGPRIAGLSDFRNAGGNCAAGA